MSKLSKKDIETLQQMQKIINGFPILPEDKQQRFLSLLDEKINFFSTEDQDLKDWLLAFRDCLTEVENADKK